MGTDATRLAHTGVLAPFLAFHHLFIHWKNPPDDGMRDWCLLQKKDFCADHCTHESWLLLVMVVGITLIISSALMAA